MRLAAVPPALPDLDAVNFARSLTAFDLAAQAPHFPGYPIYVLMARAFRFLGAGEILALALPGVALGGLAIPALGLALRPLVGEIPALTGAAIFALAPLAVLFGGAPSSDGAGLGALALVLAAHLSAARVLPMAARRGESHEGEGDRREGSAQDEIRRSVDGFSRYGALLLGAAAGLCVGIRPSFLPAMAFLPLLLSGSRLRWLLGAAAGVGAWLLPMVAISGPAELLRIATSFLAGHGSRWGGTIVARPALGDRLSDFGFDLAAANLGLPWAGAVHPARFGLALLVFAAGAALVVAWRRGLLPRGAASAAGLAILSCGPYAAWAFLGQNLEKARHLLPLAVGAAILLAAGLAALRELLPGRLSATAAALAPATLLLVSAPLAKAQGREASPAIRLVDWVSSALPAENAMIFTGEEARLFERYAPERRAARVGDPADLAASAQRLAAAGVAVYVTSAAPGMSSLRTELEPVAEFRCDRLIRSWSHDLRLFRFRPASSSKGTF
ncbi:hypothetical protein AKJ08_1478 [Vulgatibacter incomptus]|uniref:Glycosyltransferase RgtA/B/C/D-like domain-containing protein n=1 Tax=Vulgatibacter incomptus TaxID=1391653 RepID=A0A0K1PCE6_9BACT|nr:hypothetical protein AKJ08_1478 [Vulgatibacter incomptus]